MKTQLIDQQKAALEQQLEQLNNERIAAEKAERDEMYNRLLELQSEAADYRQQATEKVNDSEKQALYRFAAGADKEANLLRLELGLELNEPEPEPEPVDPHAADRLTATRSAFSLLLTAVCTGVAYLVTNFTAGEIEAGFISFLLNAASHIFFSVALVSGILWLSLRIVLGFIPNYFPIGVKADFTATDPRTRLVIVAGFIISIIYLFATLSHGN